MKTRLPLTRRSSHGYALLAVLIITTVSALVLSGAMRRTTTNAFLDDRSNDFLANNNAAEAAVEKVIARLKYDFESGGMPLVNANLSLYRNLVPTAAEDAYWGAFRFSDGQGNVNRTHVNVVSNYTGPMPSQYPGLSAVNSPILRIVSNAGGTGQTAGPVGAVGIEVMLALVPITQYAIFYNGLLEFSTCATMIVNGRVHANGNIFTGTSASLTFNGTVTATGTITSPANNGQGPNWANRGTYNGVPGSRTNVPSVALSVGTTNVYNMIGLPPSGESPDSEVGRTRLFNQAQAQLLVSNNVVRFALRDAPVGGTPANDPSPIILTSATNAAALATNFPWLAIDRQFRDGRENRTVRVTDVDLGRYAQWLRTNVHVLSKFPTGSGRFPTILYAADLRTTNASIMAGVRITNGIAPPQNNGLGFSLATPGPLYVQGNYNATNSSHLGTTNTASTVPSALMSDAITLLSAAWRDNNSSNSLSDRAASSATTVNAAIITGTVPSIGTTSSTFSGGVHNITRLLEDWNSSTLWLNTSIINLYDSRVATGRFQNPGVYYNPPTRRFSYDHNFMSASRQPPGIPTALVLVRMNYTALPPNTVAYVP